MKSCQSLFNSMSPFSRKKVYGGEPSGYGMHPGARLPIHLWRRSALALVPREPLYRSDDDGRSAFEPDRLLELRRLGSDVTEHDPVGDLPHQLLVLLDLGTAEAHNRSGA